jgi:acetylglutamate kinase
VPTIVLKIGGRAAESGEGLQPLFDEMRELARENRLVMVHGGGPEVTAISKRFGIEPVFHNGVRQTSAEEMDIVDMVLAGKVNTALVRLLRSRGLDAVGLSGVDGGIISAERMGGPEAQTRTGDVAAVHPRLLELLLGKGFLPVIASPSMDATGNGLNINADTVAFRIAARLKAWALVFLSDTPGILSGGSIVQALSAPEAKDLIAAGVIIGGMVPKVTASLDAMDHGVGKVIIGQYDGAGSLARLIDGKQGTRLWK